MKSYFFILFLFLVETISFAQIDSLKIDENYLEDQLYVGVTYNLFENKPKGFEQNGISYGFSVGFIKDIPFNKRRNFGLGIGLGYSFDTFNQNLLISEANTVLEFDLVENYSSNRYTLNSINIPVEFRWRTSTLEKYKFWRIYTGLTFSYVFDFKSNHVLNSVTTMQQNISALEKFQYGLSMSLGYGTWNFYANYSLTPLFQKGTQTTDDIPIDIQSLRLGLMFYIF